MRARVDLTELAEALRNRATRAAEGWHPGATVTAVRPMAGGASSLTFAARLEGVPHAARQIVVKVAPPGLPPVRNRDVLRQGRVLRALHGRPGVVVPAVLFEDPGVPPDVPPFIAMELVAGECLEPIWSAERDVARRAEIRARGLDAAAVLAAIHRVDPAEAGLGGEPVMTLAGEVARWTGALATVPWMPGDYLSCARALHATTPEPLPPVVTHGDFRLGNALCVGGRLTAVIDWEIWSISDPRVDLSWLTYLTDEVRHPGAVSAEPTGMPTRAELLDAYLAAGGAPVRDLPWFDALTRYKQVAVMALLLKRGRGSGDLPPEIERMAPALPELLREAERILR